NLCPLRERDRPEAARTSQYLLPGRALSPGPPPQLYAGRGRRRALEEQSTSDIDQAGDTVAGRLRGLSLANSRLDASIDADAAIGHIEWTLEFRNVSSLQWAWMHFIRPSPTPCRNCQTDSNWQCCSPRTVWNS